MNEVIANEQDKNSERKGLIDELYQVLSQIQFSLSGNFSVASTFLVCGFNGFLVCSTSRWFVQSNKRVCAL